MGRVGDVEMGAKLGDRKNLLLVHAISVLGAGYSHPLSLIDKNSSSGFLWISSL